MKRYLEIDKGDSIKDLNYYELKELVERLVKAAYPEVIGQIILKNIAKHETKNDFVEVGQPLLDQYFEESGAIVYRMSVGQPHVNRNPVPKMDTRLTDKVAMKVVTSDSRPGHLHTLTYVNGIANRCSCESFIYNEEKARASGDKPSCKHMRKHPFN